MYVKRRRRLPPIQICAKTMAILLRTLSLKNIELRLTLLADERECLSTTRSQWILANKRGNLIRRGMQKKKKSRRRRKNRQQQLKPKWKNTGRKRGNGQQWLPKIKEKWRIGKKWRHQKKMDFWLFLGKGVSCSEAGSSGAALLWRGSWS